MKIKYAIWGFSTIITTSLYGMVAEKPLLQLLDAINKSDLPTIKRLIETKKVSLKDDVPADLSNTTNQDTPLVIWVVRRNFRLEKLDNKAEKILTYLVEHGMPIDAQDRDKQTALMYAVRHDRPDIVECLLNLGADMSIQDSIGDTALHVAVKDNHPLIVEILLKHGADPFGIEDKDHMSAYAIAHERNNKAITDLISLHKMGKGLTKVRAKLDAKNEEYLKEMTSYNIKK